MCLFPTLYSLKLLFMQISELKKIGFNKNEAKFYLNALEFGPASIAHLSQKSGIQRSTIYEFIQNMIDKNLIIKTISGKRFLYDAVSPENLSSLIERQKQILNRLMPELLSMAEKSIEKPKFRLYEGIKGIKLALDDTLNQEQNSEILYFASYLEAKKTLSPTFMKKYLKKRLSKNITAKGIIPDEKEFKIFQKNNKKELRESIVIPLKKFPIKNEIFIYKNKISIISYGQEKVALIIESKQIADSQKAIFDLLWSSLKNK